MATPPAIWGSAASTAYLNERPEDFGFRVELNLCEVNIGKTGLPCVTKSGPLHPMGLRLLLRKMRVKPPGELTEMQVLEEAEPQKPFRPCLSRPGGTVTILMHPISVEAAFHSTSARPV